MDGLDWKIFSSTTGHSSIPSEWLTRAITLALKAVKYFSFVKIISVWTLLIYTSTSSLSAECWVCKNLLWNVFRVWKREEAGENWSLKKNPAENWNSWWNYWEFSIAFTANRIESVHSSGSTSPSPIHVFYISEFYAWKISTSIKHWDSSSLRSRSFMCGERRRCKSRKLNTKMERKIIAAGSTCWS